MFNNYLKIALRNLKRYKVYSFINIAGLAIGMACAILILLWIQNELSFNKFHESRQDIYRIIREEKDGSRSAHIYGHLCTAVKDEIPEIENSARYIWRYSTLFKYIPKEKEGREKVFYELWYYLALIPLCISPVLNLL